MTSVDKLKPKDLASFIDHTLLKPDATKQQIRKLCEEALNHHFFAVCVNSFHLATCTEILRNTKVKIACVVGFPLGANETSVKSYETSRVISLGAHEIDMVLNIGALKAKDYSFVEKEISEIIRVAKGNTVKVILETSLLTDDEKIKACEISVQAGAHYVKTSTGFSGGGATLEDVCLMKSTVGEKALIKASGGIKDFQSAISFIEAGASRLGTSSGVLLVTGQEIKSGY